MHFITLNHSSRQSTSSNRIVLLTSMLILLFLSPSSPRTSTTRNLVAAWLTNSQNCNRRHNFNILNNGIHILALNERYSCKSMKPPITCPSISSTIPSVANQRCNLCMSFSSRSHSNKKDNINTNKRSNKKNLSPMLKLTSSSLANNYGESTRTLSGEEEETSLSQRIMNSYNNGETDGILDLAKTLNLKEQDPEELIISTINAVGNNNRKVIPSIINSWIGSYCLLQQEQSAERNEDEMYDESLIIVGANKAWSLLCLYDDLVDEIGGYKPDVVTLSLVYTALNRAATSTTRNGKMENDEEGEEINANNKFNVLASTVLERAAKLSKKLGGSKRRRSLVASRRKQSGSDNDINYVKNVEEKLQSLYYGPDFQVLDETDDYVVINKPSSVVCYHRHKTTAGKIKKKNKKLKQKKKKGSKKKGNNDNDDDSDEDNSNMVATAVDLSLEDALLDVANIPLSTLNYEGRGIVHRIDRGTSGCIVLAKTDDMHAKLISEFFLRQSKKSYIAIVSNSNNNNNNEDDDDDDDDDNTNIIETRINNRPAKSLYEKIEQYTNSNHSMLKIETLTGRKHQVRIHCAHGLGQPILMDPLYGIGCNNNIKSSKRDKEDIVTLPSTISKLLTENEESKQQRFFLHASTLSIPNHGINVEAPIPSWWNEPIEALKNE